MSGAPEKTRTRRRRQDNRRTEILRAAARLFGEQGYDSTSMRDIADEVGMIAGSIYYHFKSKEDLLVAVNEESLRVHDERFKAAVRDVEDPWERLEVACATHLEAILEDEQFGAVVIQPLPLTRPKLRARLARVRDAHEELFRDLIDELPLPRTVDRKFFRLTLLGALNYSRTWYRPHRDSPRQISHNILQLLREQR